MSTSDNGIPRVVIVGGGFGGLAAAKALRRASVRVTLIDRTNHHLFQPLALPPKNWTRFVGSETREL